MPESMRKHFFDQIDEPMGCAQVACIEFNEDSDQFYAVASNTLTPDGDLKTVRVRLYHKGDDAFMKNIYGLECFPGVLSGRKGANFIKRELARLARDSSKNQHGA